MLKYSQLATLVAVADSGGIRAGSRRLNVSQPAVSRTLKEMEADAGVALVVRGAGGVTLTPVGRAVYERASVMVEGMRRIREDLDQLKGRGTSRLSFNLPSTLSMTILPEVVTRFRERMPNVELCADDCMASSSLYQLRNGTLDLLIGRAEDLALGKDYAIHPILSSKTNILCRRGHPLMSARSLAELADVGWIAPTDSPRVSNRLGDLFLAHGLPKPKVIVSCASAGVGLPMVWSSDYMTITAAPLAKVEAFASKVVAVPITSDLPDTVYSIIYRSEGVPTAPVALLEKLLHQAFPAWGWFKC